LQRRIRKQQSMAARAGNLEQLADHLKKLSEALANEDASELSLLRAKRVQRAIAQAYEQLRNIAEKLDPIKQPEFVFEPSNPKIAGRIMGIALIAQPRKPLVDIENFYGSGVYSIYYSGDFDAYRAISKKEHPIYVGKADPADPASRTAEQQGDRLSRRLKDHRRNITKAAGTLRLEDFEYRALVVQTGYQGAAEEFLIHLFKPIWNKEIGICYGLGKHGDAPTTRANLRSPWDTLHLGRDWAHRDPNMKDARPKAKIIRDIAEHLRRYPPLKSTDEILRRFLQEMRSM
jgi:hypothetical protein